MAPVTQALTPQTDVPLPHREMEVDPLRELRELTESIREDALVTPDEYIEEVHVAGGGE